MEPNKAKAVIIELVNTGLATLPQLVREAAANQAKIALETLFPAPQEQKAEDAPKE